MKTPSNISAARPTSAMGDVRSGGPPSQSQPTFVRCQHQCRSCKYEVYLHLLKLGSADSEAKLAKVFCGIDAVMVLRNQAR